MSLLIDGYNLLHVTDIFGRGPASFQRSREALLNFLAAAIDPHELPRTTIVFDASEALPGLPRVLKHSGLTVYFASDYESADDLLEELIRAESSPRKLTVVSSDHRVQRAAKRRKAVAVDSDCWYAELVRALQSRETGDLPDSKPSGPLSSVEVQWWLDHFDVRELREPVAKPPITKPPSPAVAIVRTKPSQNSQAAKKTVRKSVAKRQDTSRQTRAIPEDLRNPFPPGYAADLMRELGEES